MTMEKEVYIARQSLVAELLSRVRVLNDKVDGQQELPGSLLHLHQEMRQGGNSRFTGTENGEREKRLAMAVREAGQQPVHAHKSGNALGFFCIGGCQGVVFDAGA